MNPELDAWFATEILVHEAPLTRYLRRVWRNPTEVPDIRQDVYVRIYESARNERPTSPKSFLFATARNLLIDRIRRSRIVPIDYTQDLGSLNVLIDEISPEDRLNARQELRRLAEAFDRLSDNARAAIWLRRVEGLTQRETAQRLNMQEGTLESHLTRGTRTLAKMLYGESAAPTQRGRRKESRDLEQDQ